MCIPHVDETCLQALPSVAEDEPDPATARQKPASHALKPTASLVNPFGAISMDEPIAITRGAQETEAPAAGQLLEVDAGSMAQVREASTVLNMSLHMQIPLLGHIKFKMLQKAPVRS